MNTIISKEKLEDLLKSKDIEVRKIAENIILENFDTNFNAYVYKNLDKDRIEISLNNFLIGSKILEILSANSCARFSI